MLEDIIKFVFQIDKHLDAFIIAHGPLTYALIGLIVFCETGLVVLPFLPGDSLLFAAGAIAARGGLDVWLVSLVVIVAAVLGDTVNYSIGKTFGARLMENKDGRLLNRKNYERTQAFVDKYGAKSVLLCRFVPIARTFCPFVVGVGKMNYATFVFYNVVGAAAWVLVCVGAGYAFGNIPLVRDNFELAVLGVIAISLLPLAFEFFKAKLDAKKRQREGTNAATDTPK